MEAETESSSTILPKDSSPIPGSRIPNPKPSLLPLKSTSPWERNTCCCSCLSPVAEWSTTSPMIHRREVCSRSGEAAEVSESIASQSSTPRPHFSPSATKPVSSWAGISCSSASQSSFPDAPLPESERGHLLAGFSETAAIPAVSEEPLLPKEEDSVTVEVGELGLL
ncbi:hypothetical protein MUK42_05539 [Musa troglodytarum]|uniref:Uncharacterized protein n=1 Tax=Musa troglodytarum TaxID=320322 RepID=A0A9E7JGC2_9LILI|nr:hypothetical protein MUK42_05539 [Musa troglodytarum]